MHSSRIALSLRAMVIALAILAPRETSHAQRTTDVVADAARRRDAGDLQGAADLLRPYVLSHPENGTASRQLGQLLYWLHDVKGARSVYETSLARHPDDTELRLQYGEMLVETGDGQRAHELLDALASRGPARTRASLALGRLAWWSGDLVGARSQFGSVLAADPGNAEARRVLRDIDVSTAPWIRGSGAGSHDDQPLDRLAVLAEAGWFLSPTTVLSVGVGRMHLSSADSLSFDMTHAEVGLTHYAAAQRLELEMRAGGLRRSLGTASDGTGAAAVGIRLSRQLTARIRAVRSPYLHTTSSLRTAVMTNAFSGQVEWNDPRGWIGQAAVQRDQYPDANGVNTLYGWLLAPLMQSGGGQLQAGYGVSAQDADQSRFVARSGQAGVGVSGTTLRGYYAPYYTPRSMLAHSVLGAATIRAGSRSTIRIGGSYGVSASEDAPSLVVTPRPGNAGTTVTSGFARRTFHPYTARASLEGAATDALRLSLAGETSHSAFYSAATVTLQATWAFLPASGEPRR